jgi:uncharacterized protein YbjT (DUF2867 family)
MHVVLLSAICVQKPLLAFQQAKLAFEKLLIESGLIYSIVRPTAFLKSLSGQVERVRKGRPFVVLGDGSLTLESGGGRSVRVEIGVTATLSWRFASILHLV